MCICIAVCKFFLPLYIQADYIYMYMYIHCTNVHVRVLNGLCYLCVLLFQRKRKACSTEDEATASTTGATASGSGTSSGSDKESPPPPEKKQKLPQPSSESVTPSSSEPRPKAKSKSGQSSQASVTNGALASQPTPVGARSLSKLHASAGDSDSSAAERDKVLEMAESRKVYKSLFTSNAGERPKEQTSNWVTFFPYH